LRSHGVKDRLRHTALYSGDLVGQGVKGGHSSSVT
jgi:hypothetical protein